MGGHQLYSIIVEACGEDREAVARHLRRLADMILHHDAPGWSSSDIYGNLTANKKPLNGTKPPPVIRTAQILANPSSSEWIKSALKSALKRDPVDAANDAQVLAGVLDARAGAIVSGYRIH